MNTILNITNGDSAISLMQQANIPGDFLPWRDVLHDGPVPANLSLIELSKLRAEFIISRNWGDAENIRNSFRQRDQVLTTCHQYQHVRLWFEHDLYDQLQILQLLDWFARHPVRNTRLSLICTEQYLGLTPADQFEALLEHEQDVTEQQLQLAQQAWGAFRESTPESWRGLLAQDTSPLPFLRDAIIRQLEELPDCIHGLSRTAYSALKIIADGETRPGKVFHKYQETEARRFMGDSSFWFILNDMLSSTPAVLSLSSGQLLQPPLSKDLHLQLTPTGEKILAGELNWLDIHVLDQWMGGTHLTPDNFWCQDVHSNNLSHHHMAPR